MGSQEEHVSSTEQAQAAGFISVADSSELIGSSLLRYCSCYRKMSSGHSNDYRKGPEGGNEDTGYFSLSGADSAGKSVRLDALIGGLVIHTK